jgi:hypothetical protein
MIAMKTCNGKYCENKTKSLIEFYKKKNSKDGYRNQCKECCLKYKSNYDNIPKNIENRIKYDKIRRSTPEHKEYIKEYISRPDIKEKQKINAKRYYMKEEVKIDRNEKRNFRRMIDSKFKINSDISANITNSLKSGKQGNSWKDLVELTLL